MNITLSFDKPRYVVNEKNGVVICYLDFTVNYSNELNSLYAYNYCNRHYWHHTVKALAIVRDNDAFDEVKGKKIALAKAENKAYLKVQNYVKMAEKDLSKVLQTISNYNRKADKVINHNLEYLKQF